MPANNNNIKAIAAKLFNGDLAQLLSINFHDPEQVNELRKSFSTEENADELLERLKALQRVLRIVRHVSSSNGTQEVETDTAVGSEGAQPLEAEAMHAGVEAKGLVAADTPAEADSAQTLLASGMDTAYKITQLSQSSFVNEYGSKLGEGQARQIYRNAADIKSKAMQLYANVAALTAAPHFQALAVSNVPDTTVAFFKSLPSYDEVFGSLDYCDCSECKSIFGAAAYLVDLLRLIDKAITVPNTNIPARMKLSDRRPDLAQIPLTCEMTNNVIPYLQIVNEILARTVSGNAHDAQDPYLYLANIFYPFNLPFNRPLEEIRTLLGVAGTSLSEIYRVLAPQPAPSIETSREYLNLSIEELKNIGPQPTDPVLLSTVLSHNYGA